MNSLIACRGLLLLALVLGLILASATPALASDSPVLVAATFFQEVAGNRSKIIQMSIVFVIVGIAILYKK